MRKGGLLAQLAVFVAATGIAFLIERPFRSQEPNAPVAVNDLSRVARVELGKSGRRLALDKHYDGWWVNGPYSDLADQQKAMELATAIHALVLGSVVSSDPKGSAQYGLDDEHATWVEAYVKGQPVPVVDGAFGAEALGGGAVYFRAKRDSVVRLATGFPPALLARDPEDYREKLMFPNKLGAMGKIRLVEIVPDAEGRGLEKPVAELFGGRPSCTWKIGARKGAFYYARCPERRVTALVAAYDLEPLLKSK